MKNKDAEIASKTRQSLQLRVYILTKALTAKCDYASKSEVDVLIQEPDFENMSFVCSGNRWKVPYCHPFYIYNFAMCIAICRNIGLTDEQIQNGIATFKNPAAHEDVIHFNGKEIHYVRGKQENPEALQSQLDIIAADKRKKAVYVGMYRITDFYPHYGGSFYFFDCDFAPVVESNVVHYTAFSATIAGDLASRMILAGADKNQVTVCDSNDPATIFSNLEQMDTDLIYILTNTYHAKEVKEYFKAGGATNG